MEARPAKLRALPTWRDEADSRDSSELVPKMSRESESTENSGALAVYRSGASIYRPGRSVDGFGPRRGKALGEDPGRPPETAKLAVLGITDGWHAEASQVCELASSRASARRMHEVSARIFCWFE